MCSAQPPPLGPAFGVLLHPPRGHCVVSLVSVEETCDGRGEGEREITDVGDKECVVLVFSSGKEECDGGGIMTGVFGLHCSLWSVTVARGITRLQVTHKCNEIAVNADGVNQSSRR